MPLVMRTRRGAGVAGLVAAMPLALALALAPDAASASVGNPVAASRCVGPSSDISHATPWPQAYLGAGLLGSFTTGAGQVVAVVDTGVSAAAPALAGSVLPGARFGGGPGDTDCLGEGTFVAGLIAARQLPGAGLTGLAPAARILPVAVTSASGNASSSAVAAGIQFAVGHGASVIDVSLATPPGPSPALLAAVRYAQSRNVVVVAGVPTTEQSLGGNVTNVTGYPAAYPGVLAVAAVNPEGTPVSAGTAGVRVDLAAPGTSLVSIAPTGRGNIRAGGPGLASGFVAATAALVRSYYPRLTAAQVVQRLEATADRPGTAMPDPQVGYGIVDPYAALTALLPEEWDGHAPARPAVPIPRLPPRLAHSGWPMMAALIVVALSCVLVAGLAAAFHVVRHGRRRGWRSSAWPLNQSNEKNRSTF
jgi:membrane-anchored mycosin MYCP